MAKSLISFKMQCGYLHEMVLANRKEQPTARSLPTAFTWKIQLVEWTKEIE